MPNINALETEVYERKLFVKLKNVYLIFLLKYVLLVQDHLSYPGLSFNEHDSSISKTLHANYRCI